MQNREQTKTIHSHCKAVLDPKAFDNRIFWERIQALPDKNHAGLIEKKLHVLLCANICIKGTYAIAYPNLEDLIFLLRPLEIHHLKEILHQSCTNNAQKKYIEEYFQASLIPHRTWLHIQQNVSTMGRKLSPIWGYTVHEKPCVLIKQEPPPTPSCFASKTAQLWINLGLAVAGVALIIVACAIFEAATGAILGLGVATVGALLCLSSVRFFVHTCSTPRQEKTSENTHSSSL